MSSTSIPAATSTATVHPKVDHSNFENNAFSDFAPLLTLFGDEFTKQFLATSMGWADNILLGIAPIGVITVVVCAIRIGGNKFLKSLVGRARDSPDDEEKELLSSTSLNVREIWDGRRVVRQTGGCNMTEVLYDSTWTYTPLEKKNRDPGILSPLITLEEAVGPEGVRTKRHYDEVKDLQQSSIFRFVQRYYKKDSEDRKTDFFCDSEMAPSEDERHSILKDRAPNLTLNIDKAIPAPKDVFLFTFLGLLVQTIVMAFNATTVYYFHWLRAGSVVAAYGYPVWAVGTICLSMGVSLCARVTERATKRCKLGPIDGELPSLRVFRLQKRIANSNIPAFVIWQGDNNQIRVSIRNTPLELPAKQTTIGACLTIIGFICQNIGTRELHWSAGVSQLGATLLLAAIRAWLRRHVGDPPNTPPHPLPQGVESNAIVTALNSGCFYLLSEKSFFPGSSWGENRSRLVRRQPIDEKNNTKIELDQKPAEALLFRLLVTQNELLKLAPGPNEVLDIADRLWNAMRDTFSLEPDAPPYRLEWTQYMILSEGHTAHEFQDNLGWDKPEIVGMKLYINHDDSHDNRIGSSRLLIRSMISMSYYHFCTSDSGLNPSPDSYYETFWILSSGTCEEIENQLQIVEKELPELPCQSWIRDDDNGKSGRCSPIRNPSDDNRFQCFGLGHSSLFLPSSSSHELIYRKHRQGVPFIQFLALDIFSNFFRALTMQGRDEFDEKWGRDQHPRSETWKYFLTHIGKILTEHNICSEDDIQLAIVPTLLAIETKLVDAEKGVKRRYYF